MTNLNEQPQGKIIKCAKCQEIIQLGAKKCKHCGSDLRNWFVRHKIISFILVVLLFALLNDLKKFGQTPSENSSYNGSSTETLQKEEINTQIPKEEVALKITAKELCAKYVANEINADELYKGKLLEVTGSIERIGKDILDNPYITLKTNDPFRSIHCSLSDAENGKASQVTKGQSITIQGINTGLLMDVNLKDCKIK